MRKVCYSFVSGLFGISGKTGRLASHLLQRELVTGVRSLRKKNEQVIFLLIWTGQILAKLVAVISSLDELKCFPTFYVHFHNVYLIHHLSKHFFLNYICWLLHTSALTPVSCSFIMENEYWQCHPSSMVGLKQLSSLQEDSHDITSMVIMSNQCLNFIPNLSRDEIKVHL